ncbi:transcriptional regulator [Pseudoxanthomonas yeongjuensis]|uniref:helix-turn-helix transcriptional regulator n=1 Tax=Pseudoxanthomonas yeongjuensis TaxID=377616 RepID=UPI0013919745|nr:AlpA family transcriptional regulator [Pseudoxanthomonas yeongjuensis]KAF1717913.1 transcriptional regulator [Pseudoxanthomonas yeongjuensis]
MNTTPTDALATPNRLIRLPEVIARCGVGRTTIYEMINRVEFPAPVKIGPRSSAWPQNEVDRWIEDRIAERKDKAKAA